MIAGAGISMAIPSAQNAVMNAVAPGDLGKASGTFMTMRQLGGVFGLAIAAAVFTGAGSYVSPAAFSDGFVPRPDRVRRAVGRRGSRGRASAPPDPPNGGFCTGFDGPQDALIGPRGSRPGAGQIVDMSRQNMPNRITFDDYSQCAPSCALRKDRFPAT